MTHQERIYLAQKALLGVSIGDAFGDKFFGDYDFILEKIEKKEIPNAENENLENIFWEFTDDTAMSIAIFEELKEKADIDQINLTKKFIKNHNLDPNRGYGATLRRTLREMQETETTEWENIAKNSFEGQGSMGNGACMRVCPIGAFFFDDLEKVKILAKKSSETTHYNIEASTGAIAIAITTALATKIGKEDEDNKDLSQTFVKNYADFVDIILSYLPDCDTKSKIAKTKNVMPNYHIETIKTMLGNGTQMTAQDTVPFVIWCAGHYLCDFESALWKAISILGDRDTICAMVGGITIMSSKKEKIPQNWINSVEKFEKSIFCEK